MTDTALPSELIHESREVGALPLLRRFLTRLDLPGLFERHLPRLPGKTPGLSTPTVLTVLLCNLLLARQPLYALAAWAARRVPEYLGLPAGSVAGLNDDRVGRALDHLRRADRASLLTALVMTAVREFKIDLSELHQDTTTVSFAGTYAEQAPAEQANRPPRITFGYNKDHRPVKWTPLIGQKSGDPSLQPPRSSHPLGPAPEHSFSHCKPFTEAEGLRCEKECFLRPTLTPPAVFPCGRPALAPDDPATGAAAPR